MTSSYTPLPVSIQDKTGETAARGTGLNGQLAIKGVHLWQPLHAYLYYCVVELWRHGQCLDTYEQPFGVRTVEVRDGKFRINRIGEHHREEEICLIKDSIRKRSSMCAAALPSSRAAAAT